MPSPFTGNFGQQDQAQPSQYPMLNVEQRSGTVPPNNSRPTDIEHSQQNGGANRSRQLEQTDDDDFLRFISNLHLDHQRE